MSKPYVSSTCATNPVDASQVKNVAVEWGTLTAPECTDLNSSLQVIVDALNELTGNEFDLGCLESDITENTTQDVVQVLIEKYCEITGVTPGEVYDILSQTGLPFNLCQSDNFSCNTNSCIVIIDPCAPEPTLVEQLQALISRVVGLSDLVKTQCDKIDELEQEINQLQLDTDCCDTSQLESRITLLESNVTTINNNCC